MRRLTCLAAVLAIALAASLATAPSTSPPPPTAPATATEAADDLLAGLPLAFEPAGDGAFVSRGPGYSLALTAAEAVVGVRDGTFRIRPAGPTADPAARLVAAQPLPGTVTRLTGDDPTRWSAGLSTFARVEVRQVWPGVDMVWHGDGRRLEHDMVVAPGVDPAVVALDIDGARSLHLEQGGDLVLDLGATARDGRHSRGVTARLARPVVYQEGAGGRRQVPGEFALLGPTRIGFRLGAYDATLPLVIDPTLVTSTFLGGIGNDSGQAVAVDAQGNTYVTGSTESTDFPTSAPFQPTLFNAGGGATSDVFVSKLSPDGSRLIWSTYLGGRGRDTGFAVAVGADGSVYVGGVTESSDFPQNKPAQSAYGGGASDAFLTKIAANGTGVEWSTFVGGTQTDRARGVAVDPAGNAYLTGSTNSADFPSLNAQQPGPFAPDDLDAFLAKVPSLGAGFAFSTRLGGSNADRGLAVAVDGQGSAYVTGDTLSPGFPTVRPLQPASGGSAGGASGTSPDAFVSKYNPAGTALVYSTFLGGGDVDQGTAIAVDASGAAYVAGNTNSTNFPTVGPVQAAKGNEPDAFVTKVDPPGGALVFSTYLGGSGADGANALAVDRAGAAHVVGTTGSANWATSKAVQGTKGGGDDAFVVKLDSTGRGPIFSSFLGGRDADSGMGVAVDPQGVIRVLGLTGSSDFPSVKPVQGSRPAAGGDAFVATVNLVDAPPPAADTQAAPASSSSSGGHDRRVRLLFGVTMALLLAAVLQTLFLRRRTPAATTAPRVKPAILPPAPPGLKVLGDASSSAGKAGATTAKVPVVAKSTRKPKTRGGPKGGPAKKGVPQKKGGAGVPAGRPLPVVDPSPTASVSEVVRQAELADDGGSPTLAGPPPRTRPHEPAIAQLLEEDLWEADQPAVHDAPGPTGAGGEAEPGLPEAGPASETGRRGKREPASQWAPFDTGSTPAVPASASSTEPAPAIPPVPAEELSFWDLFPEDLPPARATAFPAEDLLVDPLALPEGPESAAGRLVASSPDDTVSAGDVRPAGPPPPPPPPPAPERPARPPEAEIVIAELLEGPVPTGLRPSVESTWAPQAPNDEFVVDDLLAGRGEAEGASVQSPSADEQARIAADRTRRRRSRRGGGRGKGPRPG